MRHSIGVLVLLSLMATSCARSTPAPTATQGIEETSPTATVAPLTAAPSPTTELESTEAASDTPISIHGTIVYDTEGDIYTMELPDGEPIRLTTDPEWDFDAEWSPDGSKIVFRSHRDGNAEIYVMNADGSGQTNLTQYEADDDWSPAWSPDGTRIAFASLRPGGNSIWVMNADGSDPHAVGIAPGVNDYPTWSPDSQRIAWNCTLGNMLEGLPGKADFEICAVNADGTDFIQLTDTEGNNKTPAWSPDGTKIAFSSDRNGWPSLPDYTPLGYDAGDFGDEELFIMDADGGNQVNLSNNPREGDAFPAWSADSHLIFTRYGCLFAIKPDGSGLTPISEPPCTGLDSGVFPDWHQPAPTNGSSGGCNRQIVFADERNGQMDLFVIAADGSGLRQLTNDSANEMSPAWSPDGTKIAYQRDENDDTEIYLMSADGTAVTNLTQNPGEDWTPAWSPDGTKIGFYSERQAVRSLYVMNPDGSEVTRIPGTDIGAAPRWSPDGTQIAFRKELPRNDEIFLVSADGTNPVNLTDHPANDFAPDWSPDGKTLIFESIRDGNYEIYAMNPDGSNLRKLTDSPLDDQHARWSPEGDVILFSHHGELMLMSPDGSQQRPLTETGRVTGIFAAWGPCSG